MLEQRYTKDKIECGCDEAGRGCLAGPVYAAAVVLPEGYENAMLNDSKKLTSRQRAMLRMQIEAEALAWAVACVEPQEIDTMNILKASFHAMNMAVKRLTVRPEMLLIDGNRFYNETDLPYQCIVKGDGKMMSIAAASILAKTHRDERMEQLGEQYPAYGWGRNKGYPTRDHYEAIEKNGITQYHRKSFKLYRQLDFLDQLSGEQSQ